MEGEKGAGRQIKFIQYEETKHIVKNEDAAALHPYEKTGFADSGPADDALPDWANLLYRFYCNRLNQTK